MKKKLLLLITVMLLAVSILALGSCDFKDKVLGGDEEIEATYQLVGKLPTEVVYGEELDISGLTIEKTVGETTTKIPVTKDMIVSGDTMKAGNVSIVFNYEGQSFTKNITVKYRVIFKDGDTVLSTQYVTSADEIEPPVIESGDYLLFRGWSPDLSNGLTDNITYTAVYEKNIPALDKNLTAVYGTKLEELTLPSNVAGAWMFDKAPSTTVGAAGGTHSYSVSFILNGGEKVKSDSVNITVSKKTIKLESIVTEFVYNGTRQIPTFKFENFTVDESTVFFFEDGISDYTSAGEYTYEFSIDDPNLDGDVSFSGTYVIKKAPITVNVDSYTISMIDPIPNAFYTVEGYDFEEFADLELSIVAPEVKAPGVYVIGAVVGNPNVELTLNAGTLTVNPSYLDIATIGNPIILYNETVFDFNSVGVNMLNVTYDEEKIEEFVFDHNPYGVWSWESTSSLGDASDTPYIYKAVFLHNDSRYEPLIFEIPIKVNKKVLHFHFSDNTVTYNGKEQGINYEIYENIDINDKGERYEGLKVLGYAKYKNVGEYTLSLSLSEINYEARGEALFTILKANPEEADFTTTFNEIWSGALNLSKITLPKGYSWKDPSIAPTVGTNKYEAIYTPDDTVNYNVVSGMFTVKVSKASVVITIDDSAFVHTAVYSGEKFVIGANVVKGAHAESTLVFTYYDANGKSVSEIVNVGTYKVVITLPETEHYKASSVETSVTITKAKNNDSVAEIQNATYGDSINVLTLPTSANGAWSWVDAGATVGNAGVNTFVAKYTDASGNYEDREVTVTVNVAKKSVKAPTAKDGITSFVYTGSEITLEFATSALYTVSSNTATNVGTYNAAITLTDANNYAWESSLESVVYVSFEITKANNSWSVAPGADKTSWTYLDSAATFSAVATFGGNATVTFTQNGVDYTATVPTDAGSYTALFTVLGNDNYFGITGTVDFTINKKVESIPEAKDGITSFVYTGSEITLEFATSELYTVSSNTAANAGAYKAILTLTDSKNYAWDGAAGASVTVDFVITKAQAVITDLSISGWVYGNAANDPSATTNFGTVVFSYYNGATKLDAKPTNAGTYTVKATVASTANFDGAEAEATFVIEKADANISANGNYTFTYNGTAVEIKNVVGSHNEASVVLTLDGGAVNIVNAGTYTVKATLAETANYNATEIEITVVVNKAVNTDVVNTNQSATYGDSIDVLTLPTNANGTWSWVDAGATVGNAGVNTLVAKYTDASGNYEDREVSVTVNVAKATVTVPTVEAKEYDGALYIPEIPVDSRYNVVENNGGTDKGVYKVVIELTDALNYKWATTDAATVTINYEIAAAINKWTDAPSINASWTYGENPTIVATPEHGGVKIEFAPYGTEDFSETLPANVGNYIVRFTTTDTNYTILTATLSFTINPAKIDVPTLDKTTFVYNGEVQTPVVAENGELYAVTYNNGSDVGTYSVIFEIVDTNYTWTDGSVTAVVNYEITKANASLTAAIEGWTYGAEVNAPTYTSVFTLNGVYFLYAGADGIYSATVPTAAGAYTVKALYAGDANITESESAPVAFNIAKASASIGGYEDTYTTEYNGNEYVISGITDTNPEAEVVLTYTKGGVEYTDIVTAGTYTVTISLPASANYEAAESVTVTVVVEKKANTETLPTYEAVYGDILSSITLPASATGTWSWASAADSVGNASATGNAHRAIFTPNDVENYATREIDVIVIVAKKVIAAPAVPEANKSQIYTGSELSVGIADTALYTVANGAATNVGDHTATITLTDPDNYAWNSEDNSDASVNVTFSITKAQNAWTTAPTLSKNTWGYGETAGTVSAVSKFGNINVSYLIGGTEYSATMPTTVGTHTIVLSVDETENYSALNATVSYTITIKYVTVPTPNKTTFVYNGAAQKPEVEANDTYYTIAYTEGVNVGTYTVTLKLKDATATRWSVGAEGSADDVVLTYEITKGQAEILSFTAPNWAYLQYAAPTATVNFGSVTYVYTDENGNVIADISTAVPGTYYVTAVVAGTTNYNGVESTPVAFNVNPASPNLGGYSAVENFVYENTVVLDTTPLYATYGGVSVSGSFAYGSVTFVESTSANPKASYVELTFTPDNTALYAKTTIKVYMPLKSVAKIGDTIYGSIESALKAATTGDVVWVITKDIAGEIVIREDVTVKSGVTLLLPFANDSSGRNTIASNGKINFELSGSTSVDPNPNSEEYCMTKVVLADGKKITVNGTLELSAQLSGGAEGKVYAGVVGGMHARLYLGANSQIVANSGSTIYCAGYIYETSANNGSSVLIDKGATLYEMFTVRDYIDGNYTAAVESAMDDYYTNPFQRFIILGISAKVRINYGAILNTWAALYTQSTNNNNVTVVNIIGSDLANANAVIKLTDSENSYIEAKLDPTTEVMDLRLYGGLLTNYMAINITLMGIMSQTITTEKVWFPISYHYNVTLSNNKETGQTNAVFDLPYMFKLMTGASLTVDEGVTLNVKKFAVYESFKDEHHSDSRYLYPNKPAAVFTLNGTMVCDEFAGKAYSTSNGARLIIKNKTAITVYEPKTYTASLLSSSVDTWTLVDLTAILMGTNNVNAKTGVTYYYENGEWKALQVSFDTDGGNTISSIELGSNVYPALPTPTKDGFVFVDWYYGDTLVREGDTLLLDVSHTLKATWKAGIGVALNPNGGTCSVGAVDAIEQDGGYVYGELPTPTRTGYTFLGWFYEGEQVNAGDVLKTTSSHTIVASWQVNTYTVTVSTSNASISGISNGASVEYGSTITFTVSFSKSDNRTVTVTDESGNVIYDGGAIDGTHTFVMTATSNITIKASSSSSVCVTPDTLVTLADGTQKRIDELTYNDELLVWNFYTGTYDAVSALIVMNHGYETVTVTTLNFADGTSINIINGHGFFDVDLNKFVIINESNANDYIGHFFVKENGDGYTTTELVSYSVTEQYTDVWSILTAVHYNAVLNGMWTLTAAEVDNSPEWLMPYEIGEDMKYDSEKMQSDINAYGLYTYEDFAEYCTYEQFVAFGFANFKVSVAKGYITWDEILFLLELHLG